MPGDDPEMSKAMTRETLTMLVVLGLIDVVMISKHEPTLPGGFR